MAIREYEFKVVIPVTDPPPDHHTKILHRLAKELRYSFGDGAKVQPVANEKENPR